MKQMSTSVSGKYETNVDNRFVNFFSFFVLLMSTSVSGKM